MAKLPAALSASTIEGEVLKEDNRKTGTAVIRDRDILMYQFTDDQKMGFMSLFRALERDPSMDRMRRYFDILNVQAYNGSDMDWLEDQVMFEGLTYEEILPELFKALGFQAGEDAPKTGPQRRAVRAYKRR